MSRSIDERIVEMKFDNKQFEGGIKESLTSLQRLEDALNKNISSESIDNIGRAASNVDLSGLVRGVESINQRFSTLGIVGMTVIQNITNALLNGLGRAVHSVTDSIVSGGIKRAMNIENAHFQLQGLIDDEKEVQTIMTQASDSVDGTAYSYDAAAKAASMFAASGLRSGEQMQQALKGISGVAATTNSDYEGISRIFTTVAGQGRLMGDQLLQLSTRGMNAAAALKDFFNGVSNGSIKASQGVADAVKQLTGASNTFKGTAEEYKDSLSEAYEAAAEKYNEEYKLRQKTLNAEYKELQKTLSKEYDARKKAYDNEYNALKESLDREYKAKQKEFNEEYNALKKTLDAEYEAKKETFDKEYEDLQKSLDAEITAQQKANSERLKEADKAYQEDVNNFKKAAEEKIALIDKEYTESLKLIDEEAYKRTKALEDQIDAIDKAAEEEEKARKQVERNTKLAELQNEVDLATSAEAREKAAKALFDYQQKIAQEELAESRKAQKTKLKEEIAAIKEETNVKKQAAKDSRDASIKAVQEETNATLEAKAEQHSKEKEALQERLQEELDELKESRNQRLSDLKKSQNEELTSFRESQNAQLEALKDRQNSELETLKESHNNQLSSLKESQNNELEALKEGQNAQLEALKEKQNEQLEALKKANNAKLKELKKTNEEALKNFSAFSTEGEITEEAIRDMVSKGLISFDIFSEAMAATFGDHAKDANRTFTGALANIGAALARTGAMFILPLIGQDGEFVKFFNVIRIKINDFNKALGASNGLAVQFTDWIKKIVSKLTSFIDKIDIANVQISTYANGTKAVFESARQTMEDMGNSVEKVVNKKIYTPFHALQDIIRSIANVFTGLFSVVKPVVQAFADVFFTIEKADSFYTFVENVRKLTSHFKLSNEQSEKLRTAFTGIFKVVDSVIGVFLRLFGVVKDNTEVSRSFGDIIIDLISKIGDVAYKISDWINNSELLSAALNTVGDAISWMLSLITSDKVQLWNDLVESFRDLTGIDLNEVAESIKESAKQIGDFLGLGFLKGIDFDSIVQAARDIGNRFLSAIKELFGIHSPSTEMEDVGNNVIQGFLNGISKGLSKITESAKSLLDSFWAGLSGSTDGRDVANELEEDQERINPTLDWITNKLIPTLTKNLGGVVALAGSGGLLYVLLEIAKSFRKITTALDVLGSVRILASSYAKDLRADAFKKTAEGIAIGVLAITAALVVLSKADPQGLARATYALGVVGTALVATMIGLMSGLEKVKTAESALNTVAIGFKKGIKNVTLAIKIDALAKAAKTLATTIGIVIADIVAIMLLYNHDKAGFDHALTVVAEIAAAIMGAVAIMSLLGDKLQKGTASFAKIGVGALALSLAVLVAIKALKAILDLNFDFNKVKDTNKLMLLVTLFGLVGVLALAIGAASRIAGKGGLKTGPLLAMCLMIVSAVYALKEVMELKLDFGWEKKLKIFNNIFIALGGLILAIGVASALSENGLKGTGAILAMCAFIATAIVAMGILAIFPEEAFRKGATSLGIILGMLALTLVFISKSFNENAGRTVLGMAVLIASIVASLAALSFVDKSTLLPAAISLGLVLLAVAVVFAAVGQIANEKSWGVVLSMVAVIAGVVAGLYVLSRVDSWENLIAAAIAMGTVLLAIAGAFKIINESKSPDLDHIMEFIVGVLGAAAIAMILRMLSDIPWENLLAAAGSISGVLLSIAGAFAIINKTNEIGPDKILAFISGCLVALTVGLVLRMCADIPWETLIATAGSIAGLLIAMGVAFAIMNGTNFNLDSAGMMIAGCIAVGAIGMALAQAATQDWQSLLAAGVSISIVLLALAITMNIVSIAGAAAEAALIGIGLLDAFIADLALVLYGLSKLADADVLKDGAEKLGMIGKALGDFVGSIIEGIGEGVGRALEAIGTSLSKFMTNAQPFFDGLDQMDDSKVQAASALAGLVLALSAAEFIDGINHIMSVFTGNKDMSSFGDKLVSFGESIKLFDEATVGVNADHLKTVAEGAKYLIDIANAVPNEGGWLAKIVGENDIAEFGRKLASFGPSLADFAKSTASITDVSNWKTIAEGTLALIDMANQIPNTGGWLAKIVGDNDIAEFGKSLLKYSIYMQSFNGYVAGIGDVTGWKNLADGTLPLINMAKQIPNSGGLASLVTGDNDIGKFGSSLNTYAYWMKSFNIYMQDITEERLVEISRGTITLINMCKQMQGIDQKQLSNFGKTLSDMAQNGLTSFINVFKTQTPIAISTVQTTITSLASSATRDVSVQTAFYQLAQRSMTQYMKGVTDNTQNVLNTIKTLLDKIVSSIKNRDREFTELGKNHSKLYLEAIQSFYSSAENVGKTFSDKVISAIKSTADNYKNIGEQLAKSLVNEFKQEGESSGERAANEILDKIFDVFNDAYDDFEKVGENIGQGLRRGIEDAVDDVAREARDMAREARDAIEDELKIYSPSRVMREDGGYVGEGFALGIIDKIRRVKQAAIQMAQTPVDAVKTALDDIPELDPTITPIVDLTNVMDAAEIINGMFSDALSSIGVNVTKASTSMTARQQTNNPQNIQNDDGSGNTNVTFIQNNNSPKALSRIDIYRQTRNQLAQFREAVERT